jgi:nucleotide-binding universal stress UspA family protein
MAIRRILVPLVGIADATRLLENAFALAEQLKAHVTVCDTIARELPYIDAPGMLTADTYTALIQKLTAEQDSARKAMRSAFESAAKACQVQVSGTPKGNAVTAAWADSGEHASAVWGLGRLADLIVARRPMRADIPDQQLVEEALFEVRRPVLLFPPKSAHLDRAAAVAWNGSLEAATALERAVDLIDRAKPVTVIQVGDLKPGALPATEAVAYLESHGCEARSRFVPDVPGSTTDVLMTTARDLRAGMLIAGAYSHSRVREALLGGVTANLLAKAHFPVFLAH